MKCQIHQHNLAFLGRLSLKHPILYFTGGGGTNRPVGAALIRADGHARRSYQALFTARANSSNTADSSHACPVHRQTRLVTSLLSPQIWISVTPLHVVNDGNRIQPLSLSILNYTVPAVTVTYMSGVGTASARGRNIRRHSTRTDATYTEPDSFAVPSRWI